MIYLLHFERPYPAGRRPQHYLGHADEGRFDRRLEEHRNGSNKARLTQVMAEAGIKFVVARTWEGDYDLEKEFKRRHRPASLCPVCQMARANEVDRNRTECISCGRTFKSYQLKPGDGRCSDCTP
jgi:hypothetical protein